MQHGLDLLCGQSARALKGQKMNTAVEQTSGAQSVKNKSRMKGATKIRLTYAEQEQVAREAARLLVSGWTGQLTELCRLAQAPLPPDRKKTNVNSMTLWIKREAQQYIKDISPPPKPDPARFLSDEPAAPATPIPVPPPAVPATQPVAPSLQSALLPILASLIDPVVTRLEVAIHTGLAAQGRAIGIEVGNAVRDAFTDMRLHMSRPGYVSAIRKPADEVAPPARPEQSQRATLTLPVHGNLPDKLKRPKLLVVGLLSVQQHEITRAFPNIEFRFLETHHTQKQVQDVSAGCNASFVMVDKVGHNLQNGVVGQRILVKGMTSNLIVKIKEKFPNEALPVKSH